MAFKSEVDWSDADIDLMRRLWGEGSSATIIVAALEKKRSRNAVLGKIHRMGLSGRGSSERMIDKTKAAATRKAAEDRKKEARRAELAAREVKRAAIVVPLPNAIICQPVTLFDLDDCQCHFPLDARAGEYGLTLYCGSLAKANSPYCAGHHRIVYEPIQQPEAKRRAA